MEVTDAAGAPLGFVCQEWSLMSPKLRVENMNHETIFMIKGPICACKCCSEVEFKVLKLDGVSQIGKIAKHWGGMAKEVFTDADTFGVEFPIDLDVKAKATLLGATFLIDFMYFESARK